MSVLFRELLKKVGSGTHTHKLLTREEARLAMTLMLTQEATPAQIGAFLIAHRIRRPTGEELTGMLDAYSELGPAVPAIASGRSVAVFSVAYDGRTRTAPMLPLTALFLAAAGCPVLMHGGDRMPTKYGVPLVELWQGLGVDWSQVSSLRQLSTILDKTGVGLLYMPCFFGQLQPLNEIRDQLGKRPPIATLELFWCPYAGRSHLISGYVHPPTEGLLQTVCQLRGQSTFGSVKGLEGSCDLPRDRTAIVGHHQGEATELERLKVNARSVGLQGAEVPYESLEGWTEAVRSLLAGEDTSEFYAAALWNAGFYLWYLGPATSLGEGLQIARKLLQEGAIAQQLAQLQAHVPTSLSLVAS